MMKSRPEPALDIRSVHEAGHAIAAVRNRVPFSYVSIERDLLPGTGGHIMVTFPRHDGTLKSVERLLVVLYAGASAADYILKLDGAFYDGQIASDKDQIDSVMASNTQVVPVRYQKDFVEGCRAKADALVRIRLVEKAIKDVASRLIDRKRLSAEQVKRIYANASDKKCFSSRPVK
jgi:hypothetical protein